MKDQVFEGHFSAIESQAWPFQEARRAEARSKTMPKKEVIFITEYGP